VRDGNATTFRQHLRSAASRQLVVPSYRLSSYGHWAFSIAGPTMWNSTETFAWSCSHHLCLCTHLLKTVFFTEY